MALVKRNRQMYGYVEDRHLMHFGFEAQRNIEDVTESQRALGRAGSEWGRELDMYMFQGNGEEAFVNWELEAA